MSLDQKDLEMMAVSVPTVDWWDIREEIDNLTENVNRLQTIVEALAELYRTERVKTWEMVLTKMLERQERRWKGKP